MNNENAKAKKPLWFTLLIVVLAICVLVIASVLIYNAFFRKAINQEKNRKIAEEYMTETLQSNSEEAKIYREENNAIIEKYGLDIYGTYSCTFNEIDESQSDKENAMSYTKEVTTIMELKDDFTAKFADGTTGWWMLKETDDGVVHMGLVLPEEKTPQVYMVCSNSLIDESKACFWGEVPEGGAFDAVFTSGGFTLEFSADGSVDGEYTEMVKENGSEYPRTEAYSGQYRRDGNYLDIVLNGAPARYYIFKNELANTAKPLSGFASRYYVKN